MKVQVKMAISAEDLFDSITESVLYDAEQAKGKKIPVKKLKAGFSYQKMLDAKVGGAQHVTTKITDFEPPYLYAASITTSRGVNTDRYEIEEAEGRDAEGEQFFLVCHANHGEMIAQEAGGDHIDPSIILIHAEDQLMSAETFKILAGKFIDLAKKNA